MNFDARIYVAGHRGLVGSAIVRCLRSAGCTKIITRTHAALDLMDQAAVRKFFEQEKPEYVFLAAAKVGGILANSTYPADFIYQNLAIQNSVIGESHRAGVKRLLFLGSSCIYPRDCPQPIKEEYLLTGPLESTNRPYALAKIAGIEMCWSYNRQYGTRYLAAMPTNLYGPGDNYDLQKSHVIPALIRKMHEAKESSDSNVVIWGSGSPMREFLYSDDAAAACVYLMSMEDEGCQVFFDDQAHPPLVNIGSGVDISIRDLGQLVAKVVGFERELVFDASKPDGTPRKLMDVTLLASFGWRNRIKLEQGLSMAYADYRNAKARGSSKTG